MTKFQLIMSNNVSVYLSEVDEGGENTVVTFWEASQLLWAFVKIKRGLIN